MKDPRIEKLANILVNYSTKVKGGESVLVRHTGEGEPLAVAICDEVFKNGGEAILRYEPNQYLLGLYNNLECEQLEKEPKLLGMLIRNLDVYIVVSDNSDLFLSDVDSKKRSAKSNGLREVSGILINEKRWNKVQYPASCFAELAGMSPEEYENFVYDAVLLDWEKESEKMSNLAEIISKGENVKIIGEKTNLTMSIKDRLGIKSDGTHNLPGGEVFTCPDFDSINGEIYFDLPAVKYGWNIKGVNLKFENGKLVEYSAEKNPNQLKELIESDEGSKRVGELGIGINYGIKKFTNNILFDEKIGGTIHLALGIAFDEAFSEDVRKNKELLNKIRNDSSIHVDFIKSMKNNGELYVDDELIQKNGEFVKGILD